MDPEWHDIMPSVTNVFISVAKQRGTCSLILNDGKPPKRMDLLAIAENGLTITGDVRHCCVDNDVLQVECEWCHSCTELLREISAAASRMQRRAHACSRSISPIGPDPEQFRQRPLTGCSVLLCQ
eukprot:1652839-Amphidinium_carterae.1